MSGLLSYYLPPSHFLPLNFPIFVQGFLFQFCEVGELASGNHPQPNLATSQRGKWNFFKNLGLNLAIFSPFFPPFYGDQFFFFFQNSEWKWVGHEAQEDLAKPGRTPSRKK
jgi:hypothetical protein